VPQRVVQSMTINITGKNVDLGESLREYALDKIDEAVDKYFVRPISGKVVIEKTHGDFVTSCSVHLHSGLDIQTSSKSHDAYAGVDEAVEKMEKQLRRYKRRLKNHHATAAALPGIEAMDYTIGHTAEEDADHEAEERAAPVIAEEQTTIPILSVSDAVMRMDLAGALFLIFRNAKHDRINVVYRRADGNIGWIDPGGVTAKKSR
jgi:ribosomal subunit interface protein